MKQLIPLWLLLLLLLAACSGPAAEPQVIDEAPVAVEGQTNASQIGVLTNDFAAGRPRVPFALFDGPEEVADATQITLTAFDLSTDPPTAGWSGEATAFNDYEVPYWVAYPELPAAGIWGLQAAITLVDGQQTTAQFTIQVEEENAAPAVGETPPASENRTIDTEPDLALLTSDPDPDPVLYEMTLAEAMASGRPTIVTFATPAFCQTKVCTPVVDSVKAVQASTGDEANFIHIEIYDDFQELTLAPPVEEWNLPSEPWTFVLDEEGVVVARFGGPISPRELEDALVPVLTVE